MTHHAHHYSTVSHSRDIISLSHLTTTAIIGIDAWQRPSRPRPIVLDLKLTTTIELASESDDVTSTIHYGHLCKAVTTAVETQSFDSIRDCADAVCAAAFESGNHSDALSDPLLHATLEVTVTLPGALLLADSVTLHITKRVADPSSTTTPRRLRTEDESFAIAGASLACIVGVNPHERHAKQRVYCDVRMAGVQKSVYQDYPYLFNSVTDFIEDSSYATLEALARGVIMVVLRGAAVQKVTVSLRKPSALAFVGAAGVEMTRGRGDFDL